MHLGAEEWSCPLFLTYLTTLSKLSSDRRTNAGKPIALTACDCAWAFVYSRVRQQLKKHQYIFYLKYTPSAGDRKV